LRGYTVRFFSIAVVLLCLAGCAAIDRRSDDGFSTELDSNSDGKVTLEEFYTDSARQKFREMDRDSDGAVSWEEWQSSDVDPKIKAQFEAIDETENKRITFFEFLNVLKHRSNAKQVFNDLDKNKDGVLMTQDERMDRKSLQLIKFHF